MAVLPGRRLIPEKVYLPTPIGVEGAAGLWARGMRTAVSLYLTDVAFRLNRALLRDGSVQMTGALKLKVFTEATKPSASAGGAGAVIFVNDGSAGNKFQGSDGSSWLGLG